MINGKITLGSTPTCKHYSTWLWWYAVFGHPPANGHDAPSHPDASESDHQMLSSSQFLGKSKLQNLYKLNSKNDSLLIESSSEMHPVVTEMEVMQDMRSVIMMYATWLRHWHDHRAKNSGILWINIYTPAYGRTAQEQPPNIECMIFHHLIWNTCMYLFRMAEMYAIKSGHWNSQASLGIKSTPEKGNWTQSIDPVIPLQVLSFIEDSNGQKNHKDEKGINWLIGYLNYMYIECKLLAMLLAAPSYMLWTWTSE